MEQSMTSSPASSPDVSVQKNQNKKHSDPKLAGKHIIERDIAYLIKRLAIITGGITLASSLVIAVVQILSPQRPLLLPTSLVALLIVFVCGLTLLLVWRGQTSIATHIYSYGLVLTCSVAMIVYGGPQGPVVIGYFAPIAAAGLLGRSRDALFVSLFALLCYVALIVAQQGFGVQPLASKGNPFMFLVFFLASGGILAYLSGVTSHELTQALLNSSKQASDLLERTHQLEDKNNQQIELGSELSAAASQLQITSQQQASGATEQASAVSQVSTTVEELGATARQIAQSAENVAQAAQQTLEHLSNGQGAVDESVQAMERIRVRMQDISTRVLSLGERSQQIGEIIDLIDDISDETHLLALNAAIEAAGAGEHGRRFAVVAAEVKSLANRTLAAAKEVQGVIAEIRQATNAAVLAAEEGGKEVERGAELSYRAGQVMDTILMVAERTAQSGSEIGMATAQQQSASEQVVEAMREIAEVARQSASGARQMAESASMLTAIADRLHGITQQE
jgi:methyl-accepting chemotaxis protein